LIKFMLKLATDRQSVCQKTNFTFDSCLQV